MGHGAREALEEARRQGARLRVEGAEVRQEVLARARRSELVVLVRGRLPAKERGEVREDPEDLVLEPTPVSVSGPLAGQPRVVRGEGARLRGIPVEAEDEPPRRLEVGERASGRRVGTAGDRAREDDALPRRPAVGDLGVELQEGRARRHLRVRGDEDVAHPARERRRDRGLHLHGFEHGERVAGRDLVARLHGERDHDRGGLRADDPHVGAGEAVGDAVHLDEVARALGDGDDAVAAIAEQEPALEASPSLHLGVEALSVHLDPIVARPPPEDAGHVGLARVLELDEAARIARDLGTKAGRGLVELRPVAGELLLVDLDRGLRESGLGVGTR
jgi:hypothetical protein